MSHKKISQYIFLVLVFFLPLNIGKHYVVKDSYVYGLTVDYLIPVIYVQDLLVVLLLFFWFLELVKDKDSFRSIFFDKYGQVLFLFLFSLIFSIINSERKMASVTFFLRTFLYSLITFYVRYEVSTKKFIKNIVCVSFVSIFLLSVLGVMQLIKQGSVFNNYLYFGEQPYNKQTRGITSEYFFGSEFIPPYGLFRHPNTFSGYLTIFIVWFLMFLVLEVEFSNKKSKLIFKLSLYKNKYTGLYYLVLLLALVNLLITLSIVSYVCFILSLFLLFMSKGKKFVGLVYLLIVVTLIFSLSLPVFRKSALLSKYSSFYRRADLLVSNYRIIKDNALFGLGYGTSTSVIEDNKVIYTSVRFIQPVHNIFVLILSEAGVFSAGLFLCLIYLTLKACLRNNTLFLVPLFTLVFIGCFDHYLITMHQTHLLFWITLGLSLIHNPFYAYNTRDA
ncbi:O-antigen ligase family protein [Patescibacteria group bacterium]|nr:O-antigen ligase family protein [Patescibacteria group bacterium]